MANYDRFSQPMSWEREEEGVCRCSWCGDWMYEGDKYVELCDEKVCMECIEDSTHYV